MHRDIIHFRSHRSRQSSGENLETRSRKARGEFESIEKANLTEDIRSISWKHTARTGELMRVSHIDDERLHIMTIGVPDTGWSFSVGEKDLSKYEYYSLIKSHCMRSSQFLGHHYTDLGELESLDDIPLLLNKNAQNTGLLIIVISSLEEEAYSKLSSIPYHYDTVIIHLLHSFENTIDPHTIIEGHIIPGGYLKKLEQRKNEIESRILRSGGSIVFLDTHEESILKLNHFFKHRYDR